MEKDWGVSQIVADQLVGARGLNAGVNRCRRRFDTRIACDSPIESPSSLSFPSKSARIQKLSSEVRCQLMRRFGRSCSNRLIYRIVGRRRREASKWHSDCNRSIRLLNNENIQLFDWELN